MLNVEGKTIKHAARQTIDDRAQKAYQRLKLKAICGQTGQKQKADLELVHVRGALAAKRYLAYLPGVLMDTAGHSAQPQTVIETYACQLYAAEQMRLAIAAQMIGARELAFDQKGDLVTWYFLYSAVPLPPNPEVVGLADSHFQHSLDAELIVEQIGTDVSEYVLKNFKGKVLATGWSGAMSYLSAWIGGYSAFCERILQIPGLLGYHQPAHWPMNLQPLIATEQRHPPSGSFGLTG